MKRAIWKVFSLACVAIPMVCVAQTGSNAQKQGWLVGPFTRPVNAPVISPAPQSTFTDPISGKQVHWEALHTFNPAAIVRDGKIYVLYRAEDDTGAMVIGEHTSRLGLAESEDGLHFNRLPEPVFYPAHDSQQENEVPGGVEDPRIVEGEDGTYVLTYTQWARTRGVGRWAGGIMSRARNSANTRASSLSLLRVLSAITRSLPGWARTTRVAVSSISRTNHS